MGTYRPRSRKPGGRLLYILPAAAAFAALLFWASSRFSAAVGFAPFLLILLLCPFFHFFMHRGHGSAGGAERPDGNGVHRH